MNVWCAVHMKGSLTVICEKIVLATVGEGTNRPTPTRIDPASTL